MNNLKPGDTVLVIAPARKVAKEELYAFFQWASAQGFIVEESPNLYQEFHQFSGTDMQRTQDLIWAVAHPTAKAVFCARGGYGSMRTLFALKELNPALLIDLRNFTPKWFIGFSDVTVLHFWLNNLGWPTIHAPVAVQWNNSNEFLQSLNSLEMVLFKQKVEINTDKLMIFNKKEFNGKLLGGNLSLIYSLQGSNLFQLNNKTVLFIEDLDEYQYHIDRMITTLLNNCVFDKISALLVGGISELKDNTIPFGISHLSTLEEIANNFNIPIISHINFQSFFDYVSIM
jgi:muramoyltetrapeptide carboxypeptidase